MKRLIYILLLLPLFTMGQDVFGLAVEVSRQQAGGGAQPTVEHYENRAGAANPDSSTLTGGWVGGNAATWGSSTAQARTGTTSFVLDSSGGEQFRYFDFSSGASGQIDFSGGETVTITGWVYATSGANPDILLTGSSLSKTAISFTPNTWTQFTFSNISITSSGNMYFYIDGLVYIDDLRVYSQ